MSPSPGYQMAHSTPSRVDNLLSLSNITNLTLRASLLRIDPDCAQPKICLDRLSSDTLVLSSLTVIMDVERTEEVEMDWSDWGSDQDSPPPPLIKKKTFHPNLSILRILNPIRLVVQAQICKGHNSRDIQPFFVEPSTANIISNWPRLRLVRLVRALLHTSTDGYSDSKRHRIIPIVRSRTSIDLPLVPIHIHLLSSPAGRLPDVSGPYENEHDDPLDYDLLTYLANSLGKRFSSLINLCYVDETARTLLEDKKGEWGDSWPDQFQIRPMREAMAAAKRLLEDGT